MKIGIMQPYFLPYIGYWQLISYVDVFVIYDNIEYTKKGWINRNRYMLNGKPMYMTVPLVKGSDYLDIRERIIAEEFWKGRIKNQINSAYKGAPFFFETFKLFEAICEFEERNLFDFLFHSISLICDYLDIKTQLMVSSHCSEKRDLKAEERVIALCKLLNGSDYINPIGGVNLYKPDRFGAEGLRLRFLNSRVPEYKQFDYSFLPSLSILDVLMFCGKDGTERMLYEYDIV